MRVVISAGGTGGHIYPALAIINKIKEKEKKCDILYIGTTDRMEKDIVPKLGIKYVVIEMEVINRKKLLSNISVFIKYKKAINKAKKAIKEFKPDVVIGVGGYITAPVLIAAHKLKIKTVIHEQNSVPGVSNKLISKYADKICVSLPNTVSYFNKEKTVYTGNPRSEEIINIKPALKKDFGLDEDKKLVLIVMGSLGSKSVNEKMISILKGLNDKDYNVIYVTGKNNYQQVTSQIQSTENVKITDYIDGFNVAGNCDLVMSRAGATSLCEYCALALPSILVPSPYVTNNHQLVNALSMVEAKASVLLEEKDLNEKETIEEIARIASGEITDIALSHAKELKNK